MIDTNPVLVRFWRGENIESIHRGSWALTDTSGIVQASAGEPSQLIFGRSSTKSFQALPLIETGAADAFGLPEESLAIALASHSGEQQHEAATQRTLDLIGLSSDHLGCGPQAPMGSASKTEGQRILNNCSGKHAGFLAVSQHIGANPAEYLTPDGAVQTLVRDAVIAITGVDPDQVATAIDGCGAPTFQLPLLAMATGIARISNPVFAQLDAARADACQRFTSAASHHPELVAGSSDRVCSDLLKASSGRLFAKIGAEGVYLVGAIGSDRGLAIKIDDGNMRAIYPLLMHLLQRFGLINESELQQLSQWTNLDVHNWDKQLVGRIEVVDGNQQHR